VANGNRPNPRAASTTLLTVLIVVAVLYFAREVLIPLALATLLAFLLAPLVTRLRHWGLGRVPSALVVVLLFFAVLGVIGTVMTTQLADLGHKLPEYQQNVHKKLETLRASGGGYVQRATALLHDLSQELTPKPSEPAKGQPGEVRPVPVEVRPSPFSPVRAVQTILGSVVSILVTAGIVIVFVIFMLIEQDDLRDRLIRLAGAGRIGMTTKVLADAASRVSRYLLAQLVVNIAYGVLAGIGLHFLRVPNPLLWGMLAALFRYIPYLGIWIAAIMPALVAFAVEPEWARAPLVFALYFGIDLFMYNFAEPLLYGSSPSFGPGCGGRWVCCWPPR
jgi:predicted PurR-regulated permease PerM